MATIKWASQARADLEKLSDYYRSMAPAYAEVFEEKLLLATRQLEVFALSGRVIPEIGDEQLREVLYRGYRIMYHADIAGEEVEILAILHSSQQFGGIG